MFAFLLVAGTALEARADGNAILKKVDASLNRYKRIHYRYDITTTKRGSGRSTIDVEVWMKNSKSAAKANKQLTEIHNGDLKGTLVLSTSKNSMHMYMPAFKKIRRIGSSDQSGSFLGTALTPGIMNLTRYTIHYNAKVASKGAKKTVLWLSAKSAQAPFPKIKLTVNRKFRPTQIDYYNGSGKMLVSERRERYTACKGKYCTAKKMTVIDHGANVKSVLKLKKYKINGKLKRNGRRVKFSKRELN